MLVYKLANIVLSSQTVSPNTNIANSNISTTNNEIPFVFFSFLASLFSGTNIIVFSLISTFLSFLLEVLITNKISNATIKINNPSFIQKNVLVSDAVILFNT